MPIDLGNLIVDNAILGVNMGTSGDGTVTEINTGEGLIGGPIVSSGTIALALVESGKILANLTSETASPAPNTLSEILDFEITNQEKAVVYRNSNSWGFVYSDSYRTPNTLVLRNVYGGAYFGNIDVTSISSSSPLQISGHCTLDQTLVANPVADNLLITNSSGQAVDSGCSVLDFSQANGIDIVASIISYPILRYLNKNNNQSQYSIFSTLSAYVEDVNYFFVSFSDSSNNFYLGYASEDVYPAQILGVSNGSVNISFLTTTFGSYVFSAGTSGISAFLYADNEFGNEIFQSLAYGATSLQSFNDPATGLSYVAFVDKRYPLSYLNIYVFDGLSFSFVCSITLDSNYAFTKMTYFYDSENIYLSVVDGTAYFKTYRFDGTSIVYSQTTVATLTDSLSDITSYVLNDEIWVSTVETTTGNLSSFVWHSYGNYFALSNILVCNTRNDSQITMNVTYSLINEKSYLFASSILDGSVTTALFDTEKWQILGTNYYVGPNPTNVSILYFNETAHLVCGLSNNNAIFLGAISDTLALSQPFFQDEYVYNNNNINPFPYRPDFSNFSINTLTQNNSMFSCVVNISFMITQSLGGKIFIGSGNINNSGSLNNLSEITPATGNGIYCVNLPWTVSQTVLKAEYLLLSTEGDIIIDNVTTQVSVLPLNIT